MRNGQRFKVAVGFAWLLVATLPIISWISYVGVVDRSLTIPLSGLINRSTSRDFSLGGGHYRVSLYVIRDHPFRETECLAGVGMPFSGSNATGLRTDCPSGFYAPSFRWRLFDQGTDVSTYSEFAAASGAYSDAEIGRDFCEVNLKPNHLYNVQLSVGAAPAAWASANPRFVIKRAPLDVESRAFLSIIPLLLSLIFAGIGVSSLFGVVWSLIKDRRLGAD